MNNEITQQVVEQTAVNWWMIVAIIEFVVLIFLIITMILSDKIRKKSENKQILKGQNSKDIDFDNIFKSSFQARELCRQLRVKCHPDRYENDENLRKIAEEISLEIGKNKNDYKKLLELKEQAENLLNIKF